MYDVTNEQPGDNEKERNVPSPKMKREDDEERQHSKEREDWELKARHLVGGKFEDWESRSPRIGIPERGSG